MMRRLAALVLAAALAGALPAFAVTPDEMLQDPSQEARARALSADLRCMVCQNQSIDDSDADLAHDIRVLIRQRIVAGDSDRAVIDFLVARYGEFILLQPPLSLHTILLWATPVGVLVVGGVVMAVAVRRRRRMAEKSSVLSPEEEARLAALIRDIEAPGGLGEGARSASD